MRQLCYRVWRLGRRALVGTTQDFLSHSSDLEAFNGDIGYAEYNKFQVGSASTNYVLRIGGFSGSIDMYKRT